VFTVRKIESFDLAELQPYRTMRRQEDQRRQGIFVAEGEKVVRRLLESSFTVVSLLLPERWFQDLEPRLRQRPENIQVFVAEKELLEKLTGFSMYQGLLALGQIPPQRSLEDILRTSAEPYLLAAVDGLSSAENVGALVRNCSAFRVDALIVGETSGSPFLRRAVRSSMGTVFQLPIFETSNLATEIEQLRGKAVRCIAAHPHVEGRTLWQAEFRQNCCIVFGSEGLGISPRILELCDDAVAIPMPPTVDSLNVGSAAAVFLYEANRQRTKS
jgi:tRNA G18 (ribose-2'-O)-methylase SpoU